MVVADYSGITMILNIVKTGQLGLKLRGKTQTHAEEHGAIFFLKKESRQKKV